jgi:hypothetical protein
VINQLAREYKCKDDILRIYHEEFLHLLEHICKCHNSEANLLAPGASGYRLIVAVELTIGD